MKLIKSLIFFLCFLLCLNFSFAFMENLKHYSSCDNINEKILISEIGNNFNSSNNIVLTSGLKIYAINTSDISGYSNGIINKSQYTINFWLKNGTALNLSLYQDYGIQKYYSIRNNVISLQYDASYYACSVNIPQYFNNSFNMFSLTFLQNSGINVYVNSNLIASCSYSFIPNYINTMKVISFGSGIIDEISIYDKILNTSEINTLYNDGYGLSLLTDKDFNVVLSAVNSYILNDVIYIYPLYKESKIIEGYYSAYTKLSKPYYSHICDFNTTIALKDYFNYDNITLKGWNSDCNYKTSQFLSKFGLSLFLNNTECVSTITKNIDVKNNAEFSFIAKPVSYNQPLNNLSSCFYIGLKSSLNEDLTPIKVCYNSDINRLIVYAYTPNEKTVFDIPYNNEYINITQYIDLKSKSYSMKLIDYNNNIYLSEKLDFYYAGVDIGKIIISPISDISSTYIDNIEIYEIKEYPTLYLYNATFSNKTNNYVIQDKCDYSKIKCYTSRFYLTNGEQIYNNYKDYKVCSTYINENGINTLTGESHLSTSFGMNLDETTKLTIVFIVVLFVFLLCIGIGFSSNNALIGLVIGGVLSVALLFFASIIGWLPIWLPIALIVISIAVAIFGSIFLSKGSNG